MGLKDIANLQAFLDPAVATLEPVTVDPGLKDPANPFIPPVTLLDPDNRIMADVAGIDVSGFEAVANLGPNQACDANRAFVAELQRIAALQGANYIPATRIGNFFTAGGPVSTIKGGDILGRCPLTELTPLQEAIPAIAGAIGAIAPIGLVATQIVGAGGASVASGGTLITAAPGTEAGILRAQGKLTPTTVAVIAGAVIAALLLIL